MPFDKDGELIVPFVRSAYNYDMDSVSRETALECKDESLAVQSSKDEVDINTIVHRFGLTGELPTDIKPPVSGDFVDVMDYQSSLNAVIAADKEFMRMPAKLRARFNHSPQKLMEFLSDTDNRDEAVKLGLIPGPKPLPTPLEVRVVPDPAAPGNSST